MWWVGFLSHTYVETVCHENSLTLYQFGDLSKFKAWQLNPFSKRLIVDSSKLNEFADNSFRHDENGRKFSKWVENTVGKGEITHYEQFLLFAQCFQKTCTADT